MFLSEMFLPHGQKPEKSACKKLLLIVRLDRQTLKVKAVELLENVMTVKEYIIHLLLKTQIFMFHTTCFTLCF